jgi:NitT/TauT family transport system permease protein/taurine transport system permease protein
MSLRIILPVASFALLFALWWYVTGPGALVGPFVLPSPGDVGEALQRIAGGYLGATVWAHLRASMTVMLSGFVVALVVGICLGVAMARFRIVDVAFGPLLSVLRPVPPPAWIPLAILWFGIGLAGKTFIVFVAAFVPVLVNTYVGCKETPRELVAAARTLGARNRVLLSDVVLPSALPVILTGVRISLGVAWATIVAAELVVAQEGFGYLIMSGYRNFEASIMAAGIVLIGAVGIAMNIGFLLIQRRILRAWGWSS